MRVRGLMLLYAGCYFDVSDLGADSSNNVTCSAFFVLIKHEQHTMHDIQPCVKYELNIVSPTVLFVVFDLVVCR